MNSAYWHQRAAPWVSASVLIGGLVTALILMMLVRIQNNADNLSASRDSLVGNLSNPSPASQPE